MAWRYEPGRNERPVDPLRCVASVPGNGWHRAQCSRKRVCGEWCKQHSPEVEKARRKESDDRYREERRREREARIAHGLESATDEQLLNEARRRGLLGD